MTREQQIEMQYVGVLSFLCEHSVYLGRHDESMEIIAQILDDAKKVIPNLKWRRILDRYEISLV